MAALTCGSLFAGIGGFDLGFERAGIKTIWQVEIDEYCRRVLRLHFRNTRQYEDVRKVHKFNFGYTCGFGCEDCIEPVDILCGGFPCQDLSIAASTWTDRPGLDGERSGLAFEFLRLIGELRPRIVVMENVTALLKRGMGRILGRLAALGYDAEWHCIPATYAGARHIRDRVWIVAYPSSYRLEGPILTRNGETARGGTLDWSAPTRALEQIDWNSWLPEPAFMGKADAVPGWMDRINGLGNAVVPQIAEWIGRRIVECDQLRS